MKNIYDVRVYDESQRTLIMELIRRRGQARIKAGGVNENGEILPGSILSFECDSDGNSWPVLIRDHDGTYDVHMQYFSSIASIEKCPHCGTISYTSLSDGGCGRC